MDAQLISLQEVEAALAFHMRGYDKATQKLSREASAIVDIYGRMIYERQMHVAWDSLTEQQQELVVQMRSARAGP